MKIPKGKLNISVSLVQQESIKNDFRRCHRGNSPPTSSNTSDGSFHEACEEQMENDHLENVSPLPEVDSLDSDDSSQEHEIEGMP